ncbi:uncharacterized protein LOC128191266 [Crassostrea angulata]|uniref:uncharacterized protein LOC128191266 n=1 Tax=Magallana angulata TaxID=2784310 RepID=UPI0022B14AE5|nr:uncharacterized protein LOC128191266 [Crassostrea angulata]
MPKRKATHAHVGPARVDRPKRKQATTPAPAKPPVPALGLTDDQLRHLAKEVASRFESRIGAPSAGNTPSMVNIPTMDNIPANLSDPFEPEPEPDLQAPSRHCDHKHREQPPVACQPQPPSHLDTLYIAATPIDVNKLRELLLTTKKVRNITNYLALISARQGYLNSTVTTA